MRILPTINACALIAIFAAGAVAQAPVPLEQIIEEKEREKAEAAAEQIKAEPGTEMPAPEDANPPRPEADDGATPDTPDATSDDQPAARPGVTRTGPDRIRSLRGDETRGVVKMITEDGGVHFTSVWLAEPVRALPQHLEDIRFSRTAPEPAGPVAVMVTNGDRIVGELTGADEEYFIVQTALAGTLNIPRAMVATIMRTESDGMLIDSEFMDEDLGPWKPVEGEWLVDDGKLQCKITGGQRGGQQRGIAAEVPHEGSFTIEVDMEAPLQWQCQYQISFLASDTQQHNGPNITVQIQQGYLHAWVRTPQRGHQQIGYGNFQQFQNGSQGKIRCAFDATDSELTVWIKGAQVGQWRVNDAPKDGKYVVLRTSYGEKTDYVHMYRGVIPPGSSEFTGNEDTHVVIMANGDRFSTDEVGVEGESLTAVIGGMDLRFPLDKFDRVIMRSKGRHIPRRRKGDVRIRTGHSVVTARLRSMDNERLEAICDYLGDLALNPAMLRRLEFNIYGRPGDSSGETSERPEDSATTEAKVRISNVRVQPLQIEPGG